jgi:Fe-Mn family superoxide dismutase
MFRTRLLRMPRQALGLGVRASVNSSINASFSAGINARRSLHSVPTLPHDYSEGVPNLMSPGGFAIAWTDYMTLMVDKLNAMIAGKHKGSFLFYSSPSCFLLLIAHSTICMSKLTL